MPRRSLLGSVLAIAPVTLRNLVVGGDAVLISYNSGINFYIGNNSRYEETVAIRPGWEWDALAARPRQAGLERPSRQSAFFWAEAWREIRSDPADYLRLLARKLFLLGHGEEIGRNQPIYFHRNESSLLAALLWKHGGIAFPFGIAGPLALSGLLLALRNRRGAPARPCIIITYGAGVIAFFITARYRLPMVPVLLLFAAHAAHWTAGALRRRRWRAAALVLGTTGVFAAAANYRVSPMDMQGDAAHPLQHRGRPGPAGEAPGGSPGPDPGGAARLHALAGVAQPRHPEGARRRRARGSADLPPRGSRRPRAARTLDEPGRRPHGARRVAGGRREHIAGPCMRRLTPLTLTADCCAP